MKTRIFSGLFFSLILFTIMILGTSKIVANDLPSVENLQKLHKHALETGDEATAKRIEADILNAQGDAVIKTKPFEGEYKLLNDEPEGEGDWLSQDNKIYEGPVSRASLYKKHVDLKAGEDNNLYAAVNIGETETGYGSIKVYRSADNGKTWSRIMNLVGFSYISTISMLVESRNNLIPDSTRIYVFYTGSSSSTFDNAELKYATIRRNGTGFGGGTIASPSAGNEFTSVSALSDGAFYQNATYIGVVCNEVSNNLLTSQGIKYYSSVNWGASWTGASFVSGFQDFSPSADYKFSGDSVYIAIERRFSATDKQIRMLSTKFTPTSSFYTRAITTGSVNTEFETPCLTIKQNSTTDSMMISCLKNSLAIYYYSTNGGNTWSNESVLSTIDGVNAIYCSSSISGENPFTVCWSESVTGLLNIRRGSIGNMGSIISNVNQNQVSNWVTPVCLTVNTSGHNLTAVAYSEYGPQNLYFDLEANSVLNLSIALQGLYNSITNQLNRQDTIKLYWRNATTPYTIVDSSTAYIDRYTLNSTVYFSRAVNQNHYVEIRTKNTIAVWCYLPADPDNYTNLDLLRNNSNTYGNNMVRINNTLGYYGLYCGDVNQDGIIDGTDNQLIDNDANVFLSGYSVQDLNGDNFVDGSDALIAGNNSFNFISVITPP